MATLGSMRMGGLLSPALSSILMEERAGERRFVSSLRGVTNYFQDLTGQILVRSVRLTAQGRLRLEFWHEIPERAFVRFFPAWGFPL